MIHPPSGNGTQGFVVPYGAEPEAPKSEQDYVAMFTQLAPGLSTLVQGKDPRETAELLRAKIKNYEKMKRTPPYNVIPGVLWYDNEIAKMKARLKAIDKQAREEQESVQAGREWRALGQTALVVGIATGAALFVFMAVATAKVARSNPRRNRRNRRR